VRWNGKKAARKVNCGVDQKAGRFAGAMRARSRCEIGLVFVRRTLWATIADGAPAEIER
jgi:hypothetical protein